MRVETVLGDATVNTFHAGYRVKTVSTKWEGARLVGEVVRPVGDVYGIEIRLEPDAGHAGGRVLWSGTVMTALGAAPLMPEEATLFLNALRPAKPRRRYRRRAGA